MSRNIELLPQKKNALDNVTIKKKYGTNHHPDFLVLGIPMKRKAYLKNMPSITAKNAPFNIVKHKVS
jgi:hypothetical protein